MEQKEKNKEILDALYRKYAELILKTSYMICHNRETAENITNDVFLTLSEMEKLPEPSNYQSWLIKVTKNKTLNQMEKERREILTNEIETVVDAVDYSASLEDAVIQQEEKDKSRNWIQTMLWELRAKNERWYQVITMAYIEGLSQVKIAEVMGISENSVYAITCRAKKWMRKNYNSD